MDLVNEKLERLKASVEAGLSLEADPKRLSNYVTDIVVLHLEEVLRNVRTRIEQLHTLEESEVGQPSAVVHYTSIATLVSLLRGAEGGGRSSLRLYDSYHFNDPDEGNFFDRNIRLPRKVTRELVESTYSPHAYVASFIVPYVKPGRRGAGVKRDMENNLAFWRAYGNEGMGCSLKLVVPRERLQKVLYGREAVRQTHRLLVPVLESILNCLTPLLKLSLEVDLRQHLTRAVVGHIDKIRYLYKSEAYDYERECRLVIPEVDAQEDLICFECEEQDGGNVSVKHYYEVEELEVKNTFVTGSLITLGPRVPKPDNVRYYLEALLRKAGRFYGPKFRTSLIPYQLS